MEVYSEEDGGFSHTSARAQKDSLFIRLISIAALVFL